MKKKKIGHYSGIGGQAVLEGVMMRNKDMYSVAVRKPDGEIEVEIDEYHGIASGSILMRIPFVRGIFVFIDSLAIGMKALNFSSSLYGEEDVKPTKADLFLDRISKGHGEKVVEAITMLISFALAIGIFVLLPYFIADVLTVYIRNESLLSLMEGIVRILIFILYILLISRMKDIHRLFCYHGAEHKCINCIEKGRPLTVKNAMRSSRLHKRCGSSFILFVMFVSIVLFFFIRVQSLPMRLLLRILLIPVISGISYEIIRLAGRSDNPIVNAISAPGLWLQRLTTKEPDETMVEVGIKAVEAVFDWKAYLKDSFGYEIDDSWLEEDSEADDDDSEDSTDEGVDIDEILKEAEEEDADPAEKEMS